jgi:hypothetical protein
MENENNNLMKKNMMNDEKGDEKNNIYLFLYSLHNFLFLHGDNPKKNVKNKKKNNDYYDLKKNMMMTCKI